MADASSSEITFTSETFREIFQRSSEGILMVNEKGKILIANPVAEKLFGYHADELKGIQLEDLLPDRFKTSHTEHRKHFNAHPSPRRMGIGRDLMAMKKNGEEFPVEVSLSYNHVNGQFIVMAFVIDITERKKVEEALRRSEEQLMVYAAELEKKVQARTEALNESVNELEKANRVLQQEIKERKRAEEEAKKSLERERELNELKSKFVSIASHEFRTPLSTVLSSASLVNQYKEKGDLDKIDKHINRIKSSVNHLTSILNDFLSLGKLEEGKIELEKEEIDLSEFITEIMEDVRPLLKEKQFFSSATGGTERRINTDPKVLRNIFFNLISNASKYSDSGKRITIHTEYNKSNVIIHVKDEGIGIPKQEAKHLYERFFRASNVTNIQGTGLGLNIVKRYIDLLKGSINFESEERKGSTFTITLPY